MAKFTLTEVSSTPSPPDPGQAQIYLKTDHVVYTQDSSAVETPLGSSSSITALTSDVSATGPGSAVATVNSVGGSTASAVNSATVLSNNATSSNTANQIVKRDGSGNFSAGSITANLVGNVTGNVSGTASNVTGVVAIANGGTNSSVALNNSRVMKSDSGSIVEAAAISANRALTSDAAGIPTHSITTDTELSYVNGVTSSIQTQLNNKQPLDSTLTSLASYNTNGLVTQTAPDTFTGRTITGTASRISVTNGDGVSGNPTLDIGSDVVTHSGVAVNNNRILQSSGGSIVESAAITANKALASNASGIPVASSTTDTELGYVSGVTSAIQTQINTKVNRSGDTMTGAFIESVVALTDAATITTDASLGNIFTVTLGGNRTLGAPTNPTNGQKAIWRIRQDGTGSRTLTYNSVFRFGSDSPSGTLSTTANKTDYLLAIYNSTDSKWDTTIMKGF